MSDGLHYPELPVIPGDPSVTPRPDYMSIPFGATEPGDPGIPQEELEPSTPEHWKQIKVRYGEVKTMIDGRVVAHHDDLEFTCDYEAESGIMTLRLKGETGLHFTVTMHSSDTSEENMALICALMMRLHGQHESMFQSSIDALVDTEDIAIPLYLLDKEAARAYAKKASSNRDNLRDIVMQAFGVPKSSFER